MKRIDGTKKLLALENELQDVSKKRTAVGYIRLILNTLLVVAFSVCWILNPDFGGIPERVILSFNFPNDFRRNLIQNQAFAVIS